MRLFRLLRALPALALVATAQPAVLATPSAAPLAVVQGERTTEVLYESGLWKKAKHDVSGTYRIERRTDGDSVTTVLALSDDFSTKDAPDLKIVLSPRAHDDVKSKSALDGGTIVGLLRSNRGAQEFELPADIDLSDYRSVLVHCEEYTILWASAPLERGDVIARGSDWTKKTNKIKGAWELAQVGDRLELRVSDSFKTKKAPDLKFVLSPHTSTAAANGNAMEGALVLSPLAQHKGAQRFSVAAPEDLSAYRSLLLHCEQYTKLWGAASL